MKLFIFSASVFYILGLKLTSNMGVIQPQQQKSTGIEQVAVPIFNEEKPETKPEPIKKDSLTSDKLKSKSELARPTKKHINNSQIPG